MGIYDGDILAGFAMYGYFSEPHAEGRVWLDLELPDIDGLEGLKQIRRRSWTPVIIAPDRKWRGFLPARYGIAAYCAMPYLYLNHYAAQTFTACKPRLPLVMSKVTDCPSSNDLKPSVAIPEK